MKISPKEINTAVVLANAAQLGTEVLMRMSRANISGAVNNQTLTRSVAGSLIVQTVREKVLMPQAA